ncbi:hypothetical protein FA95DRAFT_1578608 [Auriscalpium vulgare]|uniref:Uncharacterized protein n=1 Tax=Auriscalpium vulgare TaxID=40419 RepID=A0ACB8R171_9AGAM|nr:hypothetical protein FA95DRAFT_1578608 [Auriscalpium vulgare]
MGSWGRRTTAALDGVMCDGEHFCRCSRGEVRESKSKCLVRKAKVEGEVEVERIGACGVVESEVTGDKENEGVQQQCVQRRNTVEVDKDHVWQVEVARSERKRKTNDNMDTRLSGTRRAKHITLSRSRSEWLAMSRSGLEGVTGERGPEATRADGH